MITNEEEERLLKQLQSSDAAAFRELFDTYYKYLTVTAYRYLNDGEKSKDLVHDVFADLWNRRTALTIHSNLKAYLRQSVANKCLNYIKREKRIDFSEPERLPERPVAATAATDLEANELKEIIQTVIDQLPDRCRIIFTMSRFEEKSHKEIAQILGISTKTIENQITRALKSIRLAISSYSSFLLLLSIFLSYCLGGIALSIV